MAAAAADAPAKAPESILFVFSENSLGDGNVYMYRIPLARALPAWIVALRELTGKTTDSVRSPAEVKAWTAVKGLLSGPWQEFMLEESVALRSNGIRQQVREVYTFICLTDEAVAQAEIDLAPRE